MRRRLSALLSKGYRRRSRARVRSERKENGETMEDSEICVECDSGREESSDITISQQASLPENIIVNHNFSEGLNSWHSNQCCAYVVSDGPGTHDRTETETRGSFVIVTQRTECWQGLEQDITSRVRPGSQYSVSAIVKVRRPIQVQAGVQATLRLEYEGSTTRYVFIGRITASDEHWEKLDGSFSLEHMPERVVFYLEGPPPSVDLLIHSVTILASSINRHEESSSTMISQQASLPENIIVNHNFSEGLKSWHSNQCYAYVASDGPENHDRTGTETRGCFVVVTQRTECWQGLEQDIASKVRPGCQYSVSAIVKVRRPIQGRANVQATLRLEYEGSTPTHVFIGRVSASDEHWEKLDGSFSLKHIAGRVVFFLEGPPPGVDLLVHSVAILVSSTNQHEEANGGVTAAADDENIIQNPRFEDGLNNWSGRGCKILRHDSMEDCKVLPLTGKFFASATERRDSWNGIQQEITGRVQRKLAYEVTAVVRLCGNAGTAEVRSTLWVQMPNGREQYIGVSKLQVSDKEWVQMQGKFLLNGSPSRVMIFLEGPPSGTDLLVNTLVVKHAQKPPPSVPPNFECLSTSTSTRSRNLSANVLLNHDFSGGLDAWHPNSCDGHVVSGESSFVKGISARSGRNYAILCGRTEHWQGLEYDITSKISPGSSYIVSAWVRICNSIEETTEVRAALRLEHSDSPASFISIGRTLATELEWRELEGSFALPHVPKRVIFFLEGPPAGVDLLIDSVMMYSHTTDNNHLLFGDNIIKNSCLKDGLDGWHPLGACTLKVSAGSPHLLPPIARETLGKHGSLSGCYILCTSRTETWMGPAQDIKKRLKLDVTYQVSAWVCVGSGANCPQMVNVAFDIDDRWVNGGQVFASKDKWAEIAGSFRVEKQAQKVVAYFQGPSRGVDLMVAGFQIFPVDRKARFDHLKEQTDKIRKRDVLLRFPGLHGGNLSGAHVKICQLSNSFPFGSCVNRSDLDNEDFVEFFLKNFNWAVFGNELKWYHTEQQRGKLNYADADEMLDFFNRHGIQTRGHCIFWEVEDAIQQWVRSLNTSDLMAAIQNRLVGLLSRYKGQFRHYDVNNEMLHGSFYRDRLGIDIIAYMFKAARELDPSAKLFVNDYNVEDGCDARSSPEMFIQQILDLQERGAPIDGIGLQAHINHPVGTIICAALDKLAILGLPIWFTELDVEAENEHVRADDLEVVLREAYAHPAVDGIVLWGFWEVFMYRDKAHLVNAEGDISEAGRRYLQLKQEWMTNVDGEIDENDEFVFRGFHGMYHVEVVTPGGILSKTFDVEKGESAQLVYL